MSDLTPAQHWILALGAPLTRRNGRRLDRLGGDGRPTVSWEAASVLRSGWRVQTASEALSAVTWLLDAGGHRVPYGDAAAYAGWDASRVCNVAGWAYAAYLVDADTAWSWHLRAVALARESFGSWAELGQSYLRGLRRWSDDDRAILDPAEQAVAWLTSDPASPWVTLPFSLPIEGAPPPSIVPREITLGDGDAKTIADAVRLAGPDGRVILPAGTYRESVSLEHSVELVARGEVTIESAARPCLRVEKTLGLLVRGIALRSGTTEKGESLNTLRVTRAYARLEDCDVQASHDGVQLATWGTAHVVRTSVHDCGSIGVNVLGGALVVEASDVRGAKKEGIRIGGEGPSVVEGSRVSACGGAGILAHEKARVRLRSVVIADNAGSGSIVAMGKSDVSIDDVSIERGKGGGVFFLDQAGGVVVRSRITASAMAAIDVASTELVRADELTITEQPTSGVLVRGGGRLLLTQTKMEARGQGHVWVMTDGWVAIADCTIVSGGLALWVQGGGVALVHGTSMEGQTGPGIDAQPGAKVEVSLSRIRDATGDGITVGDGADVALRMVTVESTGGAGVRVAAGGRAVAGDVVLRACAGGETAGEVSRIEHEAGAESRGPAYAEAFHAAVARHIGRV